MRHLNPLKAPEPRPLILPILQMKTLKPEMLTCLPEHRAEVLAQSAISLAQCTTPWTVRKDRSVGRGHVGATSGSGQQDSES